MPPVEGVARSSQPAARCAPPPPGQRPGRGRRAHRSRLPQPPPWQEQPTRAERHPPRPAPPPATSPDQPARGRARPPPSGRASRPRPARRCPAGRRELPHRSFVAERPRGSRIQRRLPRRMLNDHASSERSHTMSIIRLLPAWLHAVADYAVGITLVVVSLAVGGADKAVATGVVVGAVVLAVSMLTRYPLGV